MNANTITSFLRKKSLSESDKTLLLVTQIETPFGIMIAAASSRGICMLEFSIEERLNIQITRIKRFFSANIKIGKNAILTQLNKEIQEYFSGIRKIFDIPLDIAGTSFQKKAWHALQNIPYGKTRSYQEQAITIARPDSARAIASANRNNLICIIIPCHRVIGKNGAMAGYGGEIWRKEYLLELEQNHA
ncbi:methylated-DNA--[protein]-cysteine S-methyltransferase [Beggiatoa alba]|nr:methylated-DNA--[protein]-cysteine S-methyltransferase [Beggiatoa alba]